MIRPLGASLVRYQTVDSTGPHDGRGSFFSFVAPTVVPLMVAGGWRGVAFARLSFGGGSGSAAAVGPAKTTTAATTTAARNTRLTLYRCVQRLKAESRTSTTREIVVRSQVNRSHRQALLKHFPPLFWNCRDFLELAALSLSLSLSLSL